MPFVAVPQVCKVIISQVVQGDTMANIFHVQLGAPATSADVVYLASEFHAIFAAQYRGHRSTNWSINQAEVIALDSSSAPSSIHTGVITGTDASGSTVPNNTTMVTSWKVPTRYRGGHARSYMGGLSEAGLASTSAWSTAAIATEQGAANAFLADIDALTPPDALVCDMCVVHYTRHHVPLAPPQIESIVSPLVRARIGTQRRRIL